MVLNFYQKKKQMGKALRHVLTILLLLIAGLPLAAQAQTMGVTSFKLLENDLTAQNRATTVLDQNGDKCALIRVQTTQKGFSFDVGSAGIQKVEEDHTGEIWVYVPFGVRHISIRHPQLGTLSNYNFPVSIQKARTYEMVLTTGQVKTIVQQDLGGAYLVMNVTPAGALVYVDEMELTVEDGMATKFLSYGKHSYRVSAAFYESEAGNIEMGREKKVLDVNLKPAYGQLSITTTPESGARVYIDGSETPAGTTPFTTGRLAGGSHNLLLQLSQYESHRMTVTVPSDGTTQQLAVPLTPNFGTLSVSSAAGSRIYVDGEDKGASSWTGRLSAGQHVVEARLASHRSTSQRVDVVRGKEQSIELDAPTPIYGSLNVTSKPFGADVYVDGTKVGTTPDVFTSILEGTRSIEIRKQGYDAYTAQVNISEGKVSDLSATLVANGQSKSKSEPKQVSVPKPVSEPTQVTEPKPVSKPVSASKGTKSKNEFYAEAAVRAGSYMAYGGSFGAYFRNFNVELFASYATDEEETIGWSKGSYTSCYQPKFCYGAKLGYGFSLGKRFMITPQAGVNLLWLRDNNWDEKTRITSALLGLRMSVRFGHFGLSLTPEYAYDLTDYGVLEGVSSTIEGWGQGLNVKLGLMVIF